MFVETNTLRSWLTFRSNYRILVRYSDIWTPPGLPLDVQGWILKKSRYLDSKAIMILHKIDALATKFPLFCPNDAIVGGERMGRWLSL